MSFQPYEGGTPTLTRGLLESETEPHELSVKLVFVVLVSSTLSFSSLPLGGFQHAGFLVTSTGLGFLRIQLPLWGLLLSWDSSVLGPCLL